MPPRPARALALLLPLALPSLSPAAAQEPAAPDPAAQERAVGALRLAPERTVLPAEPVVLPMRMRGSQPGVEVWVDGEGPLFFVVDTGGQGQARVDASLVERLGLEPVGEVQGGDPTGRATRTMPVYALGEVRAGGAVFHGVRAASRDYNAHAVAAGYEPIDGILGVHLFSECVLTLDYARRQVRIERGPLAAPPGAEVLAVTSPLESVPAVPARFGDTELDLLVDTGMMGGLHLPAAVVAAAEHLTEPSVVGRARTITGEIEIRSVQLRGELAFGGLRIADPVVVFSEALDRAVIGSELLAGRILTVSPGEGRVWIREPEADAAEVLADAPIRVHLGRPLVDVTVDGRGPFPAIFDTGAGRTVIDASLAAELGLEPAGRTRTGDPFDPQGLEVDLHVLPELALGGARLPAVEAVSLDLVSLLGGADAPRLIVGPGLFPEHLVTLDLPGGRLRVARGALPEPDGARVLAWPAPEEGRVDLPRVALDVAGTSVVCDLDSGSPGGLTLPLALAEGLPLAAPPRVVGRGRTVSGEFEVLAARLDGALRIGADVIESPTLTFNTRFDVGNVGTELLGRYAVTLDRAGRRIAFAQPDSAAPRPASAGRADGRDRPRRYGLALSPEGDRLLVRTVEPGSPAERAGLRPGDRIVAVGGTPVPELAADELSRRMRAERVTLAVRRDGEELTVAMALDG